MENSDFGNIWQMWPHLATLYRCAASRRLQSTGLDSEVAQPNCNPLFRHEG